MQAYRPRCGSSEMQPKTSPSAINSKRTPSPNLRRSSSVSSASADSRLSKPSDRKPSPKPQHPSQEKQKPVRVSEMQQQWGQLQENLKSAMEELAELKKNNEESKQSKAKIKLLESEAENAKESEAKMLESLHFQTKQLEKTKILLEESKLEIRNHPEKKESLSSTPSEEGIKKLRIDLQLAVEAEENSKKAMDDFAAALKEVNSELSVTKSELANAKMKLQDALEDYHKIKLAYEESAAVWKEKEDSFINCVRISEEEALKLREEALKLRDIIKQAVKEAAAAKESLEIARYENYELNEQVSKKEIAFELMMQSAKDDHKITKSVQKYSSDRWKDVNPLVLNGHRHSSVGELDTVAGSVSDIHGIRLPSSLLGFDDLKGVMLNDADGKEKKKMLKKTTTLQRIVDALRRRRSFRRS